MLWVLNSFGVFVLSSYYEGLSTVAATFTDALGAVYAEKKAQN